MSWLNFICRTTWLGYVGITRNLQILLNTQKSPYLNQATPKIHCIYESFPLKKIPEKENSKCKKILLSSPSLKMQSTSPPWGYNFTNNPLSPNNDQHQFSPNDIQRLSRDKVMRINKMITKRKIFDLLSNFLNLFSKEGYGDQYGEFVYG